MISEHDFAGLLADGVIVRMLEPHVYTTFPPEREAQFYDNKAKFYDMLIGNPIYNRIMWNCRPEEYAIFCRRCLESSAEGWVLDAACGSLVFTANVYANYRERPVILSDLSLGMLRAAKARLVKLVGCVPDNLVFLQASVLDLPFRSHCFETVQSMNVLHVLDDFQVAIQETGRVLANGGLYLTSLVLTGRSLGDWYLRSLSKTAGVAVPRSVEQVVAATAELGLPTQHYTRGNMVFIQTQSPTAP